MSAESPTRGASEVTEQIWRRSPLAAHAVRAALMVAPLLVAWLAIHLASGLFFRPAGLLGAGLWLAQAVFVAVGAAKVIEHYAQRLMPLSVLLNMSMVFPDRAPSRFGLALKAGSSKRLRTRLDEIGTIGLGASPAEAAEHALELVAALAAHDRRTRGHTERVRAYADLIAQEMGLSEADRLRLAWGVLLHDVGKLTVPSQILNKESKLTDEEWLTLKGHPEAGHRLVEPLAGWLGSWLRATDQHHERWDGKGYPYGLSGTEISLAGRITAVADAYDVITSKRSYKEPMSAEAARQELVRCAGGQFDPEVVRAFLRASVGERWTSSGRLAWLFEMPSISQVGTSIGGAAATATVASATTVAAVTATPVLDNVDPRVIFGVNPVSAAEAPLGDADIPDVTLPGDPVEDAGEPVDEPAATDSDGESESTVTAQGTSGSAPPTTAPVVASSDAAGEPVADTEPAPTSTTTTLLVLTGAGDPGDVAPTTTLATTATTSTPRSAATSSTTTSEPSSARDSSTTTSEPSSSRNSTTTIATRVTTTTTPTRIGVTTTTTTPKIDVATTTTPTKSTAPTTTVPNVGTIVNTTTTSAPPATVPTTAAPTTTTTTTTTTTEPAGQIVYRYLTNYEAGDTTSRSEPLDLDFDAPTVGGTLGIYDTDRDSKPGLKLKRDKDGLESDKDQEFQDWEGPWVWAYELDGSYRLLLYVADQNLKEGDELGVRAGLYACGSDDDDDDDGGCRQLSEASWTGISADGFREVELDFGYVNTWLSRERLTLRIVADDDTSETDISIAYGTVTYPSRIEVT